MSCMIRSRSRTAKPVASRFKVGDRVLVVGEAPEHQDRIGTVTNMAREIVNDVQSGRAKFVINSSDVVWWGNQGRTVNDSPYWKRVNEMMLKQLPPPDHDMRAAGLEGRWFMSVGNHEVW